MATSWAARRPVGRRVAAVACGVVVLTAFCTYALLARRMERSAFDFLEATVELKRQQVQDHLDDQLDDATLLALQGTVVNGISADAGAAERAALRRALQDTRRTYGYHSVVAFDATGTLVEADGHGALAGPARERLNEALASGRPVKVPAHMRSAQDAEYGVVVPCRADDGKLLGAVYVAYEAVQTFRPLLAPLPGSGPSMETLLLERDGDVLVVVDAPITGASVPPLSRRIPVGSASHVASILYRATDGGAVTALDYRDRPVVAAGRRVPDSPYLIVTKIDEAELRAPIHGVAWGVAVGALVLLGLMAAGFRTFQVAAEREAAHRELKPLARYVAATQTITDGFALVSRDGRFLDANPALELMSGYTRAELLALSIPDVIVKITSEPFQEVFDRIATAGSARFPSRLRRRDGTIVDIDVTTAFVGSGESGEYYAFVRDVSDDLARSRDLERQNQQYAFLSRVSGSLFDCPSELGAFQAVCRLAVAVGGFPLAWIGRVDEEARCVRPVAWAGAAPHEVERATVPLDVQGDAALGLAARSIRDCKPRMTDDPGEDEGGAPWRAVCREHGLATAAALPIVWGGKPVATLLVYSTTPGFFSLAATSVLEQIARLLGLVMQSAEAARKRDEEAARRMESERRYQELFEASPMAMYIIDRATTRVIRVNRAFTELFGYTHADMPTVAAAMERMYADPTYRAKLAALWARTEAQIVSGAPPLASQELKVRSKGGADLVVQGFVAGVGGELVTGWVDLTQLRATDALLRDAQQIARLGSWVVDFRSGETTCSDALLAMVQEGAPASLCASSPLFSVLSPDDRAEAERAFYHAAAAHELFDHTIATRVADGRPRYFRCRARIDYGPEGEPLRAIGSAQDVTAEVEARRELERYRDQLEERVAERTSALQQAYARVKASDERFQHAIEAAAEGVWDIDTRTGQMQINRMYGAMLGYAPGELQLDAAGLQAQIHPDERDQVVAEIRRRSRADGAYAMEFRMRAKDGSYRWIGSHGKVVERDEAGVPLRIIGTHTDLTARREAEDALREAQMAADRANKAKSAFLANMSHEIRTPLNAIIGLTHLLRRDALEPAQVARLGKIDGSAQHLLAVINDILDLSKIEADKLTTEAIDLDVARLVGDVCDTLHLKAEQKGLALVRVVDPALPRALVGDPVRVRQLLFNLGSNAVKFTGAGSVTVEARVVAEDAAQVRVRFEVRDTGIGISAQERGRLFQAFVQADSSTTRKYGGTGLGLALCKRLVELLDGTIDVISEPGAGSTFWFELPLRRGVAAAPSDARPISGPVVAGAVTRAASARILVVDDDPINREVAIEMLHDAGYRVDAAEDGEEAVQRASTETYDLVLMDMQMPVMDGVAATEALRAQPRSAGVPVVALTANVFSEDRARCLAAGMNDFLSKPLDPSKLVATVARWVGEGAFAGTTANAGAAGIPAAVTAIDGLNVAEGVRRVGGSWPTYERLLRHYAVERRGDVAGLDAHLHEGRREDAQRAAHTLKGTGGTLGAEAVRVAAEEVEKAIREGRPLEELEAPVAALRERHRELVERLLAALPPSPAVVEGSVDWAMAREVVGHLLALLAEDNAEAVLLVRAHGPLLHAALGGAARELAQRVDRYELDVGLTVLREAVSEHRELASLR